MTQRYCKIFHLHTPVKLAIPSQHPALFFLLLHLPAQLGSHVGVQTIPRPAHAQSRHTPPQRSNTIVLICTARPEATTAYQPGKQKTYQKKTSPHITHNYSDLLKTNYQSHITCRPVNMCQRILWGSNSCNQYSKPKEVYFLEVTAKFFQKCFEYICPRKFLQDLFSFIFVSWAFGNKIQLSRSCIKNKKAIWRLFLKKQAFESVPSANKRHSPKN